MNTLWLKARSVAIAGDEHGSPDFFWMKNAAHAGRAVGRRRNQGFALPAIAAFARDPGPAQDNALEESIVLDMKNSIPLTGYCSWLSDPEGMTEINFKPLFNMCFYKSPDQRAAPLVPVRR